MMENVPVILKRSRTLTNSAAEWVETRAGPKICSQHDERIGLPVEQTCEFVADLDCFVSKDEVPEYAYISAS